MKKTLLYAIIAVAVLSAIAVLIIFQITGKKEGVPAISSLTEEQQNIEAEGPLKSEGQDLNKIIVEDADFDEIDAEIEVL